jgi:hypothetical protein
MNEMHKLKVVTLNIKDLISILQICFTVLLSENLLISGLNSLTNCQIVLIKYIFKKPFALLKSKVLERRGKTAYRFIPKKVKLSKLKIYIQKLLITSRVPATSQTNKLWKHRYLLVYQFFFFFILLFLFDQF